MGLFLWVMAESRRARTRGVRSYKEGRARQNGGIKKKAWEQRGNHDDDRIAVCCRV